MQTYWSTVTQQASWVRGQDVGISDFVATVCRQSDDSNCGIEVSTHCVTAQGRHSLDRHFGRKDDKESLEPCHFGDGASQVGCVLYKDNFEHQQSMEVENEVDGLPVLPHVSCSSKASPQCGGRGNVDPSWHQDGLQGIHSQNFSDDHVWS